MSQSSSSRWVLPVVIGVLGAAGGAGVMDRQGRRADTGMVMPPPVNPVSTRPASAGGPAIIDLTPDALSRAGIVVEAIASGQMSDCLRVPGRTSRPTATRSVRHADHGRTHHGRACRARCERHA